MRRRNRGKRRRELRKMKTKMGREAEIETAVKEMSSGIRVMSARNRKSEIEN
jgi:hypothetical protein